MDLDGGNNMTIRNTGRYEDTNYMRYYDLYGESVASVATTHEEWDQESLLADDEITDAEEGFLNGYEHAESL